MEAVEREVAPPRRRAGRLNLAEREAMKKDNCVMYHNQAEVDKYAKEPDLKQRIIETTMQQIIDSYNEFMQDLLAESQEAY